MEIVLTQLDFKNIGSINCNPKGLILTTKETTAQDKTTLMFITTCSRSNPSFREIISKHWSFLARSSATRELGKWDFMITYRKPPSLKDLLIKATVPQPSTCHQK